MRKVRRIRRKGQGTAVTRERLEAAPVDVEAVDANRTSAVRA
jgi:hypothetical protein